MTDDFHRSRENTPSCMADEEAVVLARIILDHLVISVVSIYIDTRGT